MRLPPEEAESRFVLVRGVTARVRVLDSEDRPLQQCQVDVGPGDNATGTWTDGDGTVRVGPLASGRTYWLCVMPPRERTREGQAKRRRTYWVNGIPCVNGLERLRPALPPLLAATLEPWTPHDATVRLERDTRPLPPPGESSEDERPTGTASIHAWCIITWR